MPAHAAAATRARPVGGRWRGSAPAWPSTCWLLEWLGIVLSSALLFWTAARAFDRSASVARRGLCRAGRVAAFQLFDRVLGLPLPGGLLSGVL